MARSMGSYDGRNAADKKATDYYYVLGTQYFGFDRSLTSRTYCCMPGGGYFENDLNLEKFDHFAIFTNFRDDSMGNDLKTDDALVKAFFENPDHFHLLDGYTVDGNPESPLRHTNYVAYWTAIKEGYGSGLNGDSRKRRRRSSAGHRLRRDTGRTRRGTVQEGFRTEFEKWRKYRLFLFSIFFLVFLFSIFFIFTTLMQSKQVNTPVRNYARYMKKSSGELLVAEYKLAGHRRLQRLTYDFGADGKTYKTEGEAEFARQELLAQILRDEPRGKDSSHYKQVFKSTIRKAQEHYDSKTMMKDRV